MSQSDYLISSPAALRDKDGLIKGRIYPRSEDGSISWRGQIDYTHLYPKSEYREEIETRFGRKFEKLGAEEIALIEDKQLLITLAGINHLAWLRGIKSSVPQPPIVSPTEVTSVWVVEFIPNCEDPYGLTVAGQASASLYSVSGRFQLHLAAIAENRSYVRAVRKALRIDILGKDEYDPVASAAYEKAFKEQGKSPMLSAPVTDTPVESAPKDITPQQRLATLCQQSGFTLEQIKASALRIRKEMVDNPESVKACSIKGDPALWTSFEDIQLLDCMTMIAKINKTAELKKTGKKG